MRLFDSTYAFSDEYSDTQDCDIVLTQRDAHVLAYVLSISSTNWLWDSLSDENEAELSGLIARLLQATCE